MESIEEVLKYAIELLENGNTTYCRIYLSEALENFKKANSDKELQYMKEFSDTNNLDKILDLLDEYVDLKEAM